MRFCFHQWNDSAAVVENQQKLFDGNQNNSFTLQTINPENSAILTCVGVGLS